jgi:hypothetical protein
VGLSRPTIDVRDRPKKRRLRRRHGKRLAAALELRGPLTRRLRSAIERSCCRAPPCGRRAEIAVLNEEDLYSGRPTF